MIVALLAISRTLANDDDLRLPTWSTEFEAVLVVPDARRGPAVDATLLLADFATSAPIATGTVDVKLHGPAQVQTRLTPGSPAGTWPGHLTLQTEGTYAGSLTIITRDRSDLLGLPEFTVGDHDAQEPTGFTWTTLLGGGACGVLGGLAFAVALGFGGRSKTAVLTAAVAFGIVAAKNGYAHGGEDHDAPDAPVAISDGLFLPLDVQFQADLRTAKSTVAQGTNVVPEVAVIASGGESLVFVKLAPEYFAARAVHLGARAGDQREILDGLAPGERVVVHGTETLRSLAGR